MSCGVRCRRDSDLALLWLWYRLAAVAPIGPLAWELHVPRERPKKNQKKKKKNVKMLDCLETVASSCVVLHRNKVIDISQQSWPVPMVPYGQWQVLLPKLF